MYGYSQKIVDIRPRKGERIRSYKIQGWHMYVFFKVTNKLEWGAGGMVRYFFIFGNSPTLYFRVCKKFFCRKNIQSLLFDMYFHTLAPSPSFKFSSFKLFIWQNWCYLIVMIWLLWLKIVWKMVKRTANVVYIIKGCIIHIRSQSTLSRNTIIC